MATALSTPAPNNQDTAQRVTNSNLADSPSSTPFNSSDQPIYAPASEKNILNNYRSWNYNFTIGVLPPEVASSGVNPQLISDSIQKFHILDSAGKGTKGIGISDSIVASSSTNFQETLDLVTGFNNNSSGRFDMYIDDVVIESIIGAGSPQSGSSVATNIKYTVIEPYSMNGFVEALQVASKAAGYTDYMKAVFALRVQFRGYKDTSPLTMGSEIVPNSTRYFCFTIVGVEVDVNESGTRYQVEAVPFNQLGFGIPNQQISDIKVEGNYVWEILQNYFKGLNQMSLDASKKARGDQAGQCDLYEISCPGVATVGSPQDVMKAMLYSPRPTVSYSIGGPNSFQSDIIKAKINDGLKDTNVFQQVDPSLFNGYVGSRPAGSPSAAQNSTSTNSVSDPSTGKAVPLKTVTAFAANKQIHDCIAAVVRDSEYVRNEVLKVQVEKAKTSNLMITYFTIRLETEIGDFDKIGNKYFMVYRYVLEPYQMLYTRVPGQEQGEIDHSPVLNNVKREYNYIYTGKNVDILKFQLKFDNLYFTALPAMLGNRPDVPTTSAAAAPNQTIQSLQTGSSIAIQSIGVTPGVQSATASAGLPTASYKVDPKDNLHRQTTSGQIQSDPYFKMAQTLHDAVLNSVDLIQGTLEILGDPYLLVSGGMVNQNLVLSSQYQTDDGQAPITQGDLFINVNFRNPIDINTTGPLAGFLQFDPNLLPFSGLYRVINLVNSFKDGMFTQELDIVRCPGQLLRKGSSNPAGSINTVPSNVPGTQIIKDTAPITANKIGITSDSINFENIINRGLPNIGLPGVPSNFTNSLQAFNSILAEYQPVATWSDFMQFGDPGGTLNLSNLLNISGNNVIGNQVNAATVSALTNTVNNLLKQSASAASSVINQVAISTNGVLNQTSGVVKSINSNISQLGTNPLGGINPLTQGISFSPATFGNILSTPNLSAAAISAAGSIIGNVANISNAAVGLAENISAAIPSNSNISSLPQAVSNLGNNNVSSIVGNITNGLTTLQNTNPSDPTGIATKLGITPSELSGLATSLSSKLTGQLTELASLVPDNSNINTLESKGVVFNDITSFQLPNLPPVQPSVSAPAPLVDPAIDFIADSNGNAVTLLNGLPNLPALTNINNVTNPLGSVTAGLNQKFGASDGILGQLQTAQLQVNNIIGEALGVAYPVGSLSQNSISRVLPSNVGLGSIESNASLIQSLTQASSSVGSTQMKLTANFILGSKQSQSPLSKLIQNSNLRGNI